MYWWSSLLEFVLGVLTGVLCYGFYLSWKKDRDVDRLIRRQPSIPEIPPPPPRSSLWTVPPPKDAVPMEEPSVEVLNALPNGTCDLCGLSYRKHKYDMRYLDKSGRPYLLVRCDGMRIRLG